MVCSASCVCLWLVVFLRFIVSISRVRLCIMFCMDRMMTLKMLSLVST